MKFINTLFCSLITVTLFSQETILIPDIGLEEALIDLNLDSNGLNGNILVSDAKYVVNLNINDPLNNKSLPNVHTKIKDLTGIEHFPNLKRLDCNGNEITKINLTKNSNITFLNCSNNKIEFLDISNNPELTSISCDNNKLTSLTLGEKPVLQDLYCNNNKLTSLDIRGCTVLVNLDASNNKIGKIFITKETYDNYSDNWYKDSKTTYSENGETVTETTIPVPNNSEINNTQQPQSTKAEPKVITEQPKESAANYYEKFQLSVAAEYDKLVLDPAHLQSKKDEVQKKYDLNPEQLNQWISKFGSMLKGQNTNPTTKFDDSASTFYRRFKQSAVEEYEKLVLNSSYLQSKKDEIQKKYNVNPTQLTEWINEFGSLSIKKAEGNTDTAANYYENFKQLVVAEYEKLVLNIPYLQSKKEIVQRKYNLNSEQVYDCINKYSKINTK